MLEFNGTNVVTLTQEFLCFSLGNVYLVKRYGQWI